MKNFVLILLAVLALGAILVSCAALRNDGKVTDTEVNDRGDETGEKETSDLTAETPADSQIPEGTETPTDSQIPEDTEPSADTEEQIEAFVPEEFLEFNGERYKLTFFDGFDGNELDETKWAKCPEWTRQDLGGKWDDDRAYVDGKGNLVLEAVRDKNGNLTSGAVRTQNKFYTKRMFEQARGYFETRCRLQENAGFWGAFWLMCSGEEKVGNGAVDGAEIDIMESYSVDKEAINHAVHWDGYGADHKSTGKGIEGVNVYDGEYHTFGLLWTEKEYIFFIDGVESYRISCGSSNYPDKETCAVPCYMKLSVEFGTWADDMDGRAFTDSVLFDYVRVYQKES